MFSSPKGLVSKRNKVNKGFTLVELIAVVGIGVVVLVVAVVFVMRKR